jgi:hypothetical protein
LFATSPRSVALAAKVDGRDNEQIATPVLVLRATLLRGGIIEVTDHRERALTRPKVAIESFTHARTKEQIQPRTVVIARLRFTRRLDQPVLETALEPRVRRKACAAEPGIGGGPHGLEAGEVAAEGLEAIALPDFEDCLEVDDVDGRRCFRRRNRARGRRHERRRRGSQRPRGSHRRHDEGLGRRRRPGRGRGSGGGQFDFGCARVGAVVPRPRAANGEADGQNARCQRSSHPDPSDRASRSTQRPDAQLVRPLQHLRRPATGTVTCRSGANHLLLAGGRARRLC